MIKTTISNKKIPAVQEITLVVFVIVVPFPDELASKTIVQTKGSGQIRGWLSPFPGYPWGQDERGNNPVPPLPENFARRATPPAFLRLPQ